MHRLILSIVLGCTALFSFAQNDSSTLFTHTHHFDTHFNEPMSIQPIPADTEHFRYDIKNGTFTLQAGKYLTPGNTHVEGYMLSAVQSGSFRFRSKVTIDLNGNLNGVTPGGIFVMDQDLNMMTIDNTLDADVNVGGIINSYIPNHDQPSIYAAGPLKMLNATSETEIFFQVERNIVNGVVTFGYSEDGMNWQSLQPMDVGFTGDVYVGFFLVSKNNEVAEVYAHFNEYRFEALDEINVKRVLNEQKGNSKKIDVQLIISNPSMYPKHLTLEESINNGWTIRDIHSREATIEVSDLHPHYFVSSMTVPSGTSVVEYSVLPDADFSHNILVFAGNSNGVPIYGEELRSYFQEEEIYQRPSIHIRNWNSLDGLLSSDCKYINMDDAGNIWVYNRLNILEQYNGYTFTEHPLPKDVVGVPVVDTQQNLWLIDEKTGEVYLYQNGKWITIENENGNPLTVTGLSQSRNFSINQFNSSLFLKYSFIPVDQHSVYILSSEQLTHFNPVKKQKEIIVHEKDYRVGNFKNMYYDGNNQIIIGGDRGIIHCYIHDSKINKDSIYETVTPNHFPLQNFINPMVDYAGNYYAVCKHQNTGKKYIVRISDGQFEVIYSSEYELYLFYADKEKRVWFEEIVDYENERVKYIQDQIVYELTGDGFSTIVADSDNNRNEDHFVRASADGFTRFTSPLWNKPVGLQHYNESVTSIVEDVNNRLWFLSFRHLVNWDGSNWQVKPLPKTIAMPINRTQLLAPLADGRIGFFFFPGYTCERIYTYDVDKDRYKEINHPETLGIDYIAPGKESTILASVWTGSFSSRIERFDAETFQPITSSFKEWGSRAFKVDTGIQYMYETENGDLWIASNSSKPVQRFQNGQEIEFPTEHEYPKEVALSILEIEPGVIWVGGSNSIYQYDSNGWTHIRSDMNEVNAMIQSRDGSVWVASWTGVHCYRDGDWIVHNTSDGFGSNTVSEIYEDDQGRIWAGADDGLYLFSPEHDQDPPDTFLNDSTNLSVFTAGNDVRVTFTGEDRWKYTQPERLYYSTRLDGGEWSSFSSESSVMYSNLTSGKHSVEVRAMDRSWNIDPSPAVISIEVLPTPIQQKPWFLPVIVLVGFIILILMIIAWNSRNLIKIHASNLEKMVDLRTSELRETQKNILMISEREQQRIGQDMHDGLVQDLTGILYRTELMAQGIKNKDIETDEQIQNVIQMIDAVREHTRKISHGLSPINLDQIGLSNAMKELAVQIDERSPVSCRYVCTDEISIPGRETATHLFRIAQESVQNAVKHSKAQTVIIELKKLGKGLVLTVTDDGTGYVQNSVVCKGMGLSIMKYRADIIEACLKIESKIGRGTMIQCILASCS